jgi:8-oxo-dGTP diphosphatase
MPGSGQLVGAKDNQLLEVLRGDEGILQSVAYESLTHALVVLKHRHKVLFVFNHFRQVWELPGAVIDLNESPRQCAQRALTEEAGQEDQHLWFLAMTKTRMAKSGLVEYGAIYTAGLETLVEFVPNVEVEQILLWDLKSPIGNVAAIDRTLAALVI